MRLHHFFLNFVKISVIVEYNAVGVENIARQTGQTLSPANYGRAFLHIKEGDAFMAVSYNKLWKLLIDRDMKKKYL